MPDSNHNECMRVFCVVFCSFLIGASNLHAQGNPRDFDRPGPAREREMYYAQVRTEINNVLMSWRDAWEKDDPAKLASFYTDGANYYPLGVAPAATRAGIRSHFADFLKMAGTLDVNMTSFGMSGDMAYITARLSYHAFDGTRERKIVRTDIIVLRRQRNHDWLIEAQLAQEEPAERPLP